jgi:phosphoribosyl 1,2-cyclic phosphate phosphodiesterase
MVIPKPLCKCGVCIEARQKGAPYSRTGPSAFVHDENILIDTPAEIAWQLNRSGIDTIDYLIFTHLDPDHIEGFRVVEQIAIDFRSWLAYPGKKINLVLPDELYKRIKNIRTIYGSQVDFYEKSGFIHIETFKETIRIGTVRITALPVERCSQVSFVYIFEKDNKKMIYAPCDIKPFPETNPITHNADAVFIQPGIIEGGLKHGFVYPVDHISRSTLYTMEETIALARRIQADKVIFIHIEEYWNKSFSDYNLLQSQFTNIRFAFDGLQIDLKKEEDYEISR